MYEEAHREKLYNGTLYFPPGCAVICDACDRECRFVRPDGIAPPPDSIARTGKPQGPKRRWSVARFDDTAAGVVLAGQNMPSQIEVASGDHVNARTLLKYTQVIIDRALDSDLSLLPAWQHDAIRVEAVRRVRSAVHIPFKETKRE